MVQEYKTIDEMLEHYYGNLPSMDDVNRELKKTLTTSSTGAFQTVYGPSVWAQLNQETKLFGLLPKYPRTKKGWRVMSARPSDIQNAVAEGGNLAAADEPTFAHVSANDKTQQNVYQVSEIRMMAEGQDDVGPNLDDYRRTFGNLHIEGLEASMNTDGNTLAGNALESIDRVTASAALATAQSWTTADEDIYGIDRSGNAWADAQVGHNSTTDRDLTLTILRDVLYDCRAAGAQTNIIMTGYDTYEALINVLQTQQRFTEMIMNVGAQGAVPAKPGEAGTSVLSFDGVPVFPNNRTQKDTISRVYFLDTTNPEGLDAPRLGIRIMRPPTNVESTDIIKNGAFVVKGVYSSVAELCCPFLAAQGSLRDLK